MITQRDIELLNSEWFGLQMNKFREYLQDIKCAIQLGCEIEQPNRVAYLEQLMKKLDNGYKPQSEEIDPSADITSVSSIACQINRQSKQSTYEIVQQVDIQGVQITLEYLSGELYKVCTCIGDIELDLTDRIKKFQIAPTKINGLEKTDKAIINGKIQVQRASSKNIKYTRYTNENHMLIRFIRSKSEKQEKEIAYHIKFIADSISTENQTKTDDPWKQLDLLKQFGLEIPQRIRAKQVSQNNLEKALTQMRLAFSKLNNGDNTEFPVNSIRVRITNQETQLDKRIEFIEQQAEYKVERIDWIPTELGYRCALGFGQDNVAVQFECINDNNIHIGDTIEKANLSNQ